MCCLIHIDECVRGGQPLYFLRERKFIKIITLFPRNLARI